MSAARSSRTCTFRTRQNEDVWQVSRDGVFYGDYHSHAQALAAACFGARAAEARGSPARVLNGREEEVVPHHLPSPLS
jgi:hypothetical protein